MKPKFWKLSQGTGHFTLRDIQKSIENRLVYVHKDTKAKGQSNIAQRDNFINAKIGDYFYLTHGNTGIYVLGQLTGPVNYFSSKRSGWVDRPFRLISRAIIDSYYNDEQKWWAPNDNSTFIEVPNNEISEFEQKILKPFFGIKLKEFDIII
jgi:5-methylcytosine-specific restriction protein B